MRLGFLYFSATSGLVSSDKAALATFGSLHSRLWRSLGTSTIKLLHCHGDGRDGREYWVCFFPSICDIMLTRYRPIASAVILPNPSNRKPSPPPTKRRQSSVSDQDSASKRPRLSFDGSAQPPSLESPSDVRQTQDSNQERRRISVVEEKKRGQRLFGGLLSTLSQSAPNRQQHRRQDIEKKQVERARAQKAEDEVKRKERLAELSIVRKDEQVKWDEQSVRKTTIDLNMKLTPSQMKIRHDSVRAQAQFLGTKARPKIVCCFSHLLREIINPCSTISHGNFYQNSLHVLSSKTQMLNY